MVFHIKIRPQNHSRGAKDVRLIVPKRARLLCGLFRSRNHVLVFDRLNPESRRKICKVGNQGNKRPPGTNRVPALVYLAVEMGNDRYQQVGGLLLPKFL